MNVEVTEFTHGPFVIVVTDPSNPTDRAFPTVISPKGGYKTKEEALAYIETNFAHRKVPYLGMHFSVAQLDDESSFMRFCSWED